MYKSNAPIQKNRKMPVCPKLVDTHHLTQAELGIAGDELWKALGNKKVCRKDNHWNTPINAHTNIHTHTYIHILAKQFRPGACTHTRMHMQKHTHTHSHTHTHTYAQNTHKQRQHYTYTYTHTHTHAHTQVTPTTVDLSQDFVKG
jgi:hypothetical protein